MSLFVVVLLVLVVVGVRQLIARRARGETPLPPTVPSASDCARAAVLGVTSFGRSRAGIARQLHRYVRAEEVKISRNARLAPSALTVGLTQAEYDELAGIVSVLELSLAQAVVEAAEEFGRRLLVTAPSVEIVVDEAARPGWPRIHTQFDAQGAAAGGGQLSEPGSGAVQEDAGAEVEFEFETARFADATEAFGGWSSLHLEGEFATEHVPRRVLTLPDGRLHRLPLSGSTCLGRGREANVSIASSHVSRAHARILTVGAAVYVEDLGSANGTFVNGSPALGVTELSAGCRITLGFGGPELQLNET